MYRIIVTDIYVITRLYRIGLLKYFSRQEVAFYITDLCYYDQNSVFATDRKFSEKLLEEGLLTVVKTSSDDVAEIHRYFSIFQPRFVFKTVSAMVIAHKLGYRILTDDQLLTETSQKEMGLKTLNREMLTTNLVSEMGAKGIILDIDLIKDMI